MSISYLDEIKFIYKLGSNDTGIGNLKHFSSATINICSTILAHYSALYKFINVCMYGILSDTCQYRVVSGIARPLLDMTADTDTLA